jgi:hypothetical protein
MNESEISCFWLTAERHHAMMNHVKRRDMLILLSQDEEQSVEKLGKLRDIVPPTSLRHPKTFRRVIHRLTPVAVVSQPAALKILKNEIKSDNQRHGTRKIYARSLFSSRPELSSMSLLREPFKVYSLHRISTHWILFETDCRKLTFYGDRKACGYPWDVVLKFYKNMRKIYKVLK